MSLEALKKFRTGGYKPGKEDDLQALFCQAQGCPYKWSVDAGNGRLCGEHAFAEPREWPVITEELQRRYFERQFDEEAQAKAPPATTLTWAQKREILDQLRETLSSETKDHRVWAKRLREREEAGETLSLTRRQAWREALRVT